MQPCICTWNSFLPSLLSVKFDQNLSSGSGDHFKNIFHQCIFAITQSSFPAPKNPFSNLIVLLKNALEVYGKINRQR